MIVQALAGDTVDLLCHRHLGTTSPGVVESTLELNPGISATVTLAAGTAVTLADMPTTTTTAATVTLWD